MGVDEQLGLQSRLGVQVVEKKVVGANITAVTTAATTAAAVGLFQTLEALVQVILQIMGNF